MKTLIHFRIAVAVTVTLLCGSVRADAQGTGGTRPYRALFGGSTANPDVHHSFDVTTSMSVGYDDNALGGPAGTPNTSPLLQTGGYLGASGALTYAWQTPRVQVAGNLSTNTRYYRDIDELIGTSHTGSIGVSAQVGERGRVSANQSVSYAPSYLYSLSAGLGGFVPGTTVGGGNVPLGDEPVFVYDTTASAAYSITRRGSLEAVGSYRYSDLGDGNDIALSALRSYSLGGRFRQGLSRYASLRLGYVYRTGQYGFTRTNASIGIHDIDIGVDYERGLSLTRRTTFDFSTGSTIVTMPSLALGLAESGGNHLQFRFVGDVGLTHEMGRTWRMRVGYNRGVGFAEAFAQPVFADAVSASLTGFLSRRIDVNVNGGFSSGDVGLGTFANTTAVSNSSFQTWNLTARTRYGIGSMWALYAEYLYYSQNLGSAPIVPSGIPPVLDRKSIQVGLTFWVPLLKR